MIGYSYMCLSTTWIGNVSYNCNSRETHLPFAFIKYSWDIFGWWYRFHLQENNVLISQEYISRLDLFFSLNINRILLYVQRCPSKVWIIIKFLFSGTACSKAEDLSISNRIHSSDARQAATMTPKSANTALILRTVSNIVYDSYVIACDRHT